LPALAELPPPVRELSVSGPDWFILGLNETLATANTTLLGDTALILDASGGDLAFATFGVYGFDGNSGPTSAQITLTEITGEYWVAFSDYHAGGWSHSGPYTGSATVEMPYLGEYIDPAAYTSPNGHCYFSIIVPATGSMTVSGVQLGVHSGTAGPAPVTTWLTHRGDTASVVLQWEHSPSYKEPDFAGYILERAPRYFGDYAPLNTVPQLADYYVDTDVLLGEHHRYRVCATDLAGNRSAWSYQLASGLMATGTSWPVAILNLPRGPLFAPATVPIDLSQSYVPSGNDEIIQYSFWLGHGVEDETGLETSITRTLQPGAYLVGSAVNTGGPVSSAQRHLVVYPQWHETPVVIREPEAVVPRLEFKRIAIHPAGGITLLGYDLTMPGIAIWQEQTDVSIQLIPVIPPAPVEFISEPVAVGEVLHAVVCCDGQLELLSFDGERAWFDQERVHEYYAPLVALASDGISRLWMVAPVQDGADIDLNVYALHAGWSVPTPILEDIGEVSCLDAIYCPDEEVLQIAIGRTTADRTNWYRYNVNTDDLDDAWVLALSAAAAVDLELNPSTNQPAVTYYVNDYVRYRQLAYDPVDFGTVMTIDDTIDNRPLVELAFDVVDTAYVYFGYDGGASRLYYLNEDTWVHRNSSGIGQSDGGQISMVPVPNHSDMLVADADGNSRTYILVCASDTTTGPMWSLAGAEGLYHELHGAGAADGLHAVFATSYDLSMHYTSSDGATWQPTSMVLPSESLDLATTADGELYLTHYAINQAHLRWWNPTMFNFDLEHSFASANMYRPLVSAQPFNYALHWAAFAGPGDVNYAGGSHGAWLLDTTTINQPPLWFGTIINLDWFFGVYGFAGAPGYGDGELGLLDYDSGHFDTLVDPPYAELLGHEEVWGRTLDGSAYENTYLSDDVHVLWSAYGRNEYPLRIELANGLGPELTDLPGGPAQSGVYGGRSVSAALGHGGTAVAVVCNLDGSEAYMEWSNFGRWETLPLPEGAQYMNVPELTVGLDGRWHLLYHNYRTDQLMCISTL